MEQQPGCFSRPQTIDADHDLRHDEQRAAFRTGRGVRQLGQHQVDVSCSPQVMRILVCRRSCSCHRPGADDALDSAGVHLGRHMEPAKAPAYALPMDPGGANRLLGMPRELGFDLQDRDRPVKSNILLAM